MTLTRHINNIRIFKAYSALELVKQSVLFLADYYLGKGKSSYPLNIALFTTLRCNALCSMCNLKEILNTRSGKEPALEDIDRFLSGFKGAKPSIILFGGEPFVRKDIVEMTAIVKKHGAGCGIFTNGILLNKEIIDGLISAGLDYIVFSVQGMGEVHDSVVGVKGSFDKLMHNLDLFVEAGGPTKVITHTMISEGNLDGLAGLTDMLLTKKADLIRFGHPTFFTPNDIEKNKRVTNELFAGEDISEMSYAYDPKDMAQRFCETIGSLRNKFGAKITFVPNLNEEEVRDWYSGNFKTKRKCLFLWRGCFIYPDGDVYPCESIRYPMGNIYEQDFTSIWNSPRYKNLRNTVKKSLLPACARCCKL